MDDNKLNVFQLAILAFFIVLGATGIFAFALYNAPQGEGGFSDVEIWGTLPDQQMQAFLRALAEQSEQFRSITYVEKSELSYEDELVEALAEGGGPDLFMLPGKDAIRQEGKVFVIPYESFSERAFKDTFVETGEVFLTNEGILALPFTIDPIVMYWNRDLFASAGVSQAPRYWDEFFVLSEQMTEQDRVRNILQSGVALGEYQNVTHSYEILSALFLQGGVPIVRRDAEDELQVQFSDSLGFVTPPAEAVLRFYTEFSNPEKDWYAWNRSIAPSKESFIAGDLAIYFGYASEVQEIRNRNPNLNFDVATFPQTRDNPRRITYGNVVGLAVSKQSENVAGTFAAAAALIDAQVLLRLSEFTGLPPVRRDLLSIPQTNAYQSTVYDSAVISRVWPDPGNVRSESIFREMIESVTSGREGIGAAVDVADRRLEELVDGR